eukprot:7087844-Pyramimonas_sp.AAC.1
MRNVLGQFLDRRVDIWKSSSDMAPWVVCNAASSFGQLVETVIRRNRHGPDPQIVDAHMRQ